LAAFGHFWRKIIIANIMASILIKLDMRRANAEGKYPVKIVIFNNQTNAAIPISFFGAAGDMGGRRTAAPGKNFISRLKDD
jgi:hypothetical protein